MDTVALQDVTSVTQHYASHLAPVYEWLAGGLEAAVARAAAELTGLGLLHRPRCRVVDLGAGFGAHTVALARAGHAVLALDTSPLLLQRLQQATQGLAVTAINADLREFAAHLGQRPPTSGSPTSESPTIGSMSGGSNGAALESRRADLILCMGDTLPHLPSHTSVTQLIAQVAGALSAHGVFVATFRDYSQVLTGPQRFVPVKSEGQRILTCFLEFFAEHVIVHDVLHEWHEDQWRLRVSAYPKLRLAPATLCEALRGQGLHARQESGPVGMIRIVANRAE